MLFREESVSSNGCFLPAKAKTFTIGKAIQIKMKEPHRVKVILAKVVPFITPKSFLDFFKVSIPQYMAVNGLLHLLSKTFTLFHQFKYFKYVLFGSLIFVDNHHKKVFSFKFGAASSFILVEDQFAIIWNVFEASDLDNYHICLGLMNDWNLKQLHVYNVYASNLNPSKMIGKLKISLKQYFNHQISEFDGYIVYDCLTELELSLRFSSSTKENILPFPNINRHVGIFNVNLVSSDNEFEVLLFRFCKIIRETFQWFQQNSTNSLSFRAYEATLYGMASAIFEVSHPNIKDTRLLAFHGFSGYRKTFKTSYIFMFRPPMNQDQIWESMGQVSSKLVTSVNDPFIIFLPIDIKEQLDENTDVVICHV